MRTFRQSIVKICDDGFTAHIVNNFLWGIECTLVLVIFKQVLKDTTKHFRVDTYLRIIIIVFVNGEVIAIKEVKKLCEEIFREYACALVNFVTSEQPSIKVWDFITVRKRLSGGCAVWLIGIQYLKNRVSRTPSRKLSFWVEFAKGCAYSDGFLQANLYAEGSKGTQYVQTSF